MLVINAQGQFLAGEGGIAGGLQGDPKASLQARAESFDMENSSVPFLYRLRLVDAIIEQLPESLRTPVQEAFERRNAEWNLHRKSLRDASAFEQAQRVEKEGTERQKQAYEFFNPVKPRKLDDEEKNKAFVEYTRLELEAENEFAQRISEIAPPSVQKTFFRHFTRNGHQFLVSPLGKEYLDLSDAQVIELKKDLSKFTAEVSNRLREARKKDAEGEVTLDSMDGDQKLLRLRMSMFSTLRRDQLENYFRLKGTLTPNGTIEDWIESFPQGKREVVMTYFSEDWLKSR